MHRANPKGPGTFEVMAKVSTGTKFGNIPCKEWTGHIARMEMQFRERACVGQLNGHYTSTVYRPSRYSVIYTMSINYPSDRTFAAGTPNSLPLVGPDNQTSTRPTTRQSARKSGVCRRRPRFAHPFTPTPTLHSPEPATSMQGAHSAPPNDIIFRRPDAESPPPYTTPRSSFPGNVFRIPYLNLASHLGVHPTLSSCTSLWRRHNDGSCLSRLCC